MTLRPPSAQRSAPGGHRGGHRGDHRGDRRRTSPRWRMIKAAWRDTLLLLREFGWPLALFSLAITGGGLLYHRLATLAGQPTSSPVEAIYIVLELTFFESPNSFPDAWYLQIFFFLMPVVGIGTLAQGLADFGSLFFNRRKQSKEWIMAVASTYNRHVVLVGLGHLGFRVMRHLRELDQEVVVIEQNPAATLLAEAQAMDVAVLADDGTRLDALQAAGIAKARAIIVCTQNDSLNLQIAFKARKLNPAIDVVLRIFDDDFARNLEERFGFRALSATGMASPIFAAAAAGMDITRPLTLEGESLSLASFTLGPGSHLIGQAVAVIEQEYEVSVVLLRHDHLSDLHPAGDRVLSPADVVAVLGGPEQIQHLASKMER